MDDYTVGGKYRLEEEIANGGCGTVFLGVHTIAGKEVAIKLEPAVPNKANSNSPLRQESKIYKTLMGGPGVPWIMWSGRKGDYNIMVIDLLGPSLEDLFKMCNRHFSLKTVLLLADQLISRIEFIHSHSLVHRDIKPANFVMGVDRCAHLVNVIDFGLAKKYRDTRTSNHIPYKQDDFHGVGTSLFAAINTHLGVESSRRDDLESLAYMLIYFLRGTLPWRKLRAPNTPPPTTPEPSSQALPSSSSSASHYDTEEALEAQEFDESNIENIPPEQLDKRAPKEPKVTKENKTRRVRNKNPNAEKERQHRRKHYNPISATWNLIRDAKLEAEASLTNGLPPEFDVLYRYARGLAFDDLPDYEGLRQLFRGLAERMGIEYDGVFDWTVPPPKQHSDDEEGGPVKPKLVGVPNPPTTVADAGIEKRRPGRSVSEGGHARGVHDGYRARFCEACRRRKQASLGGPPEREPWR